MKFSDLIGNEKTVDTLRSLADSGNVPHAILISGKKGIGKMRLARAFSQYLHCRNRQNGDSCGKCPSCLQHQSLNNPDIHYVYPIVKREKEKIYISKDLLNEWKGMLEKSSFMRPEDWNEIIKSGNSQPSIYVTESDDIINRASISAFQENLKIFIIWLPERLRPEAANKLLKVIEEPFEDTLFILVSNEPEKLLPTILSRTQKFDLKGVEEDSIVDFLHTTHKIEEETARKIAALANGSVAKAEELALFPKETTEFAELFADLMRTAYGLQGKKMKELSEYAAGFGREKLMRFLNYCSTLVRENFIYNLGIPELNQMNGQEEEFSKKFSPFVNSYNVEQLSEAFSSAETDIGRNANSKIVMFDLVFIVSRLLRTKPATNK